VNKRKIAKAQSLRLKRLVSRVFDKQLRRSTKRLRNLSMKMTITVRIF